MDLPNHPAYEIVTSACVDRSSTIVVFVVPNGPSQATTVRLATEVQDGLGEQGLKRVHEVAAALRAAYIHGSSHKYAEFEDIQQRLEKIAEVSKRTDLTATMQMAMIERLFNGEH